MAFLIPSVLGAVGGIFAKKAIGSLFNFGAKALAKKGGSSLLAGALGSVLGSGAGDVTGEVIGNIAGSAISSLGSIIGGNQEDIAKKRSELHDSYSGLGSFIQEHIPNMHKATAENIMSHKHMAHLKDKYSRLEDTVFGLHKNEFKDIQLLRQLDPEINNLLNKLKESV